MRRPEFVLVHECLTPWQMTGEQYRAYLGGLERDANYRLVRSEGDVRLYRRAAPSK